MVDTSSEAPQDQLAVACAAAKDGWNESDLRHRLWEFFGPWAREVLEMPDSALKQEGTGRAGRYDSRIGRAIIEYKTPGFLAEGNAANRRDAAVQALDYIDDPQMGADVVVLTDGRVWAHYRDASSGVEINEQGSLDLGLDAGERPAVDRFLWRSNHPESLARILSLVATVRSEPVTVSTIADKLGSSRSEVQRLIEALAEQLRRRQPDDRTDVSFRQWLQMSGVSYGINAVDSPWPNRKSAAEMLGSELDKLLRGCTYAESLYVLHTYIALAAKIVGIELLALGANKPERRPTSWSSLSDGDLIGELRRVEDGTLLNELRSPGLFAGDLFGWYAFAPLDSAEFVAHVRRLLIVLDELAWMRVVNRATGITGDVMREFYMHTIPRPLRKALGEFFTPQWLAEHTLSQAIALSDTSDGECRVLDPACGSGTFLVAALRRALVVAESQEGLSPAEVARSALESVTGFDINPVSVLMSRINLLLALGDRIEYLTEVVPHVYQTDSILIPDVKEHNLDTADIELLEVSLSVGAFAIPKVLATLHRIGILREMIETGVRLGRDIDLWNVQIKAAYSDEGIPEGDLPAVIDACEAVYHQMRRLNEEGRDGVWARVIEQFFAPTMFEPADVVVGNPPWINWKHLPDSWQAQSEIAWVRWGLWATKSGKGGIPLSDISVLLLARSIADYAKPGGIVGFVMPESVLIADPGNSRIRRCSLGPKDETAPPVAFRPVHVDDWTALNPFSPDAANKPVSIYVKSGESQKWPVEKIVWQRKRPGSRLRSGDSWGETASLLKQSSNKIGPLDPNEPGSRWVVPPEPGVLRSAVQRPGYRWGLGFHTHGADSIFTVKMLSAAPDQGLVSVRRVDNAGSNSAIPEISEGNAEIPDQQSLEAAYLWPLIRGGNVQPFRVESSNQYMILAHHPDDLRKVMSDADLAANAKRLLDYLAPFKTQLSQRFIYQPLDPTADPYGVRGPTAHITRTKPLVVSRYMEPNRRPPAAVILPVHDQRLGFKTVSYPNNKCNVRVCETEAEAYYMAAWVNSEPAQSAIAAISSSTTIGPNVLERLAMPRYNPDDEAHAALSEFGKQAHEAPDFDAQQLDDLVRATLGSQ
ncbi:N-6 DNA methylase [Candidatus Poriferisodalis sp.]|uniref:N-6 DNA methylase n=1 Tax=Candidatus Poriferisodalis sp. TaxID=3101277 RepID=UPI003B01BF86